MLKNLTQFKSVIQGIESTFHFDANCPIGIAKEAVFEVLKWIGQIEDQLKANEAAKNAEQSPQEAPAEPPKEDVTNEQPS